MKRLALVAMAMWVLTGCLLEHRIALRDGGAVDYRLRLGVETAIANGPLGKPADERERDWKSHLPAAAAAFAKAYVEETPENVYLIIEASLPSIQAYATFRDGFIAEYQKTRQANPPFYPPAVATTPTGAVVSMDIPPNDKPFDLPSEARRAKTEFRVEVTGPGTVAPGPGATLSADGHTAVWSAPVLDVYHDGLQIEANVPLAGGGSTWTWVAAGVALLGLGGAAAWGLKKSA